MASCGSAAKARRGATSDVPSSRASASSSTRSRASSGPTAPATSSAGAARALECLGRTDFQVKIRGFRVELGEVESALDASADVRHAVAVAAPDAMDGHRLVAYVEPQPGRAATCVERLAAQLAATLPTFMVPSQIVALERMPLTPNGKIDRNALPAPPTRTRSVRPETAVEASICAVFAEVLDLPRVGATDAFFDLGGSSVMVPRTLQRLEEELGVAVQMEAFLREPAPRAIARRLGSAGRTREEVLAWARQDARVRAADRGEAWAPSRDAPARTVLMTGASGFVGVHVLARCLAADPAGRVILLVRAADEAAGCRRLAETFARYGLAPHGWRGRVTVVSGDVTAPLLGLSPRTFERLAEDADVVLHAASSVNLLYPYEVMRRANVDGTREIVRLATTGRIKPVHYTSSLDVFLDPGLHPAGPRSLRELPIADPAGLPRGYEISKWAAETMLLDAAAAFGVPVSIMRIGMVVGQSGTGVGHETDEWHRFLADAAALRALPRMDVSFRAVPVDWLGEAVARLLHRPAPAPGRPEILHLNPRTGLSMDEVAGTLGAFLGEPVALVEPDAWFEAIRADPDAALYPLLELFAEGDPAEHRNYLQVSILGGTAYGTAHLEHALRGTDLVPLRYDAALLRRSLAFLERKGRIVRHDALAPV